MILDGFLDVSLRFLGRFNFNGRGNDHERAFEDVPFKEIRKYRISTSFIEWINIYRTLIKNAGQFKNRWLYLKSSSLNELFSVRRSKYAINSIASIHKTPFIFGFSAKMRKSVRHESRARTTYAISVRAPFSLLTKYINAPRMNVKQ